MTKEENKSTSQKVDDKKEKKSMGDSGYDCNYCHGKNHLDKDYMLRRINKKKNVAENEFGGVEVWSTDSEDDELHLDYEIGEKIHKMILPFLELKEYEIDADCYKCESIVSSDETSDAYKFGLERIESYIKSKDHKNMLKQLLDENNKKQIKSDTIHKFDSLSAKLNSANKINIESTSEFDEDSDMSKIYVEDEIDCSEFVKNEPERVKYLISGNSVEFVCISQNKRKTLKAKATVFPKVQTTPNQVFATKGLDKTQNLELMSIVNEDNKESCDDYFWSAPIDNADEMKDLSERTARRVKGRYVAEPLNNHSSYEKGSPSGTKEDSSEPQKDKSPATKAKPKVNIHNPRRPKGNFGQKPFLSNKPIEKPKSHHSQPTKASPKDVNGNGRLVLDSETQTKKSTTNPKKVKKEFVKNQNKQKQSNSKETKMKDTRIKVFTKTKKDETNLVKQTNMVDRTINFPLSVIRDEQFDTEWYIDSGCLHYMTGRKEELREFRSLKDGGNVKYGNNSFGRIKGYGMIMNGDFSIHKVAYVEGLQHNLISVS
ncbi:uncharacterized protein LOC128126067 [Lactuca sativa]|uniref:uncharacterized protein LOC128126067 n=1 Tax=Lactuca sativa TaxID=4236 RepID=UPI0022AE61E8|nr:uncharacterized protein LOC128126067 [Lactuca sativa]